MWVVRNGLPRASAAVVLAALVLAALVLAAFVLSDAALPTVRVSLCDKACCLYTHIRLGSCHPFWAYTQASVAQLKSG